MKELYISLSSADCHFWRTHCRTDNTVCRHTLFRKDPVRGLMRAAFPCLVHLGYSWLHVWGHDGPGPWACSISTRARSRICSLAKSSEERMGPEGTRVHCFIDGCGSSSPCTSEEPQLGWLRLVSWTVWWMWGVKRHLEAGEERDKELKPSELKAQLSSDSKNVLLLASSFL